MQVHLVSFNVPYPPDYGGVIDVFYKIKALHALGVGVHLHCFEYGRSSANELEKYCASIAYYKRDVGFLTQLSTVPYIVKSRGSMLLIQRLLIDDTPILFDGLHCTYPLLNQDFTKTTLVRTHNIEHDYYKGLALTEKNLLKKLFFTIEAVRLKHYENVLRHCDAVAAISMNDLSHFRNINTNAELVTPFHPFDEVRVKSGKGKYVLVHGDLSVAENIQSVQWIFKNIVPNCPYSFIVAGKNPSHLLVSMARMLPTVQVIPNPDAQTMAKLVEDAHVNLIHSFYPQGFKLKLLHALHKGRFCLCNNQVVDGTGLESFCFTAVTPEQFVQKIFLLMNQDFEPEQVRLRVEKLHQFSNVRQAEKLIKLLDLGA